MYKRRALIKVDKSLMSGSTTLLILSLLSREEMYGYQMITELVRHPNHAFTLKEGTLYPILHGLEAAWLVQFEKGQLTGGCGSIIGSQKGLKALEEKKDVWSAFTGQVNAVIHDASLA